MNSTPIEHERHLALFGSRVRILVGAPVGPDASPPVIAALEVEAMLDRLHRELTRFDPESGLSRLNADPTDPVRTSTAVAHLVAAARDAAIDSEGLVDASLLVPLEAAGYSSSRAGLEPADLRGALSVAPPRGPAGPAATDPWSRVSVDLDEAIVRRPPGMRIDSGGIGKGLAADLAAGLLRDYSSFAVDCGGDIRIGGRAGLDRRVDISHPFDPDRGLHTSIGAGAVATSGLRTRIWATGCTYSHHLIDPASGEPAWTGVVQATAMAPTATTAETLAKAALLSGPDGSRRFLTEHGGVIVLDSGEVEVIGDVPLAATPIESGVPAR